MEEKPKLKQLLEQGWQIVCPLPPHDLLLKDGKTYRCVYNREIDDVIAQYSLNYKGSVVKTSLLLNKEALMYLFMSRYAKLLCIE